MEFVYLVVSMEEDEGFQVWAIFSTVEAARSYADLLFSLPEDDPRTYYVQHFMVMKEVPTIRFERLSDLLARSLGLQDA